MSLKTKIILFQFFFVAIALVIIELALRSMGYQPGDIKPNWLNFHPVDTLYLIPDYHTNAEGLLVADSNFWAERNTHINEGGFRSKNFSELDSNKKKVLFIGDSFTWGNSATPTVDSCFVDIVRNETDYEVINLGIPAADPVQYLALTQKYLAIVKPDMLLLCFYMGNDLMKQSRNIVPNQPFYYYTNAGAILADIDGIHFGTPQAAYDYIAHQKYYLHHPKNSFEKIAAKSSLLSRLYAIKFRIEEKIEHEYMRKHTRVTKNYLWQIKQLCHQTNTTVKFVLIPEVKEADLPVQKYTERYADILKDSILKNDWLMFNNRIPNFNEYPDGHLNNTGHRFYADSLRHFLKNQFATNKF